ncbi:MAG: PEP-utilizing enzyme [Actinomycetota bacterium]
MSAASADRCSHTCSGSPPGGEDRRGGILVAADLTPADASALDPGTVRGIVTAAGGPTSHASVLARSLGIPAVVGAGDAVLALDEGSMLAIDGSTGAVVVDPDPARLRRWRPTDRAGRHWLARRRRRPTGRPSRPTARGSRSR